MSVRTVHSASGSTVVLSRRPRADDWPETPVHIPAVCPSSAEPFAAAPEYTFVLPARPSPPTNNCRDSLCPSRFPQSQSHCPPAPDWLQPNSALLARFADRLCPQRSPSSPQLLRLPNPPRALPCTPGACVRLSSWRSGCPDPSGFPTAHWKLSCPCVPDPSGAGLLRSDSRSPQPGPGRGDRESDRRRPLSLGQAAQVLFPSFPAV